MKHVPPDAFEDRRRAPEADLTAPTWRQRLRSWWQRLGWDRRDLPLALHADIERDHPSARPVRGRAEWERRL
ncbi:hypothetical protein [Aureimonas sp. SK2]|uniref:hypothetical protein n=1 Tax=Aureimonas sp. SK2 TaxID=3015992 RepID=UPI002443F4E8|nr:hypothetical protein [Aureimonas sp. SK2]